MLERTKIRCPICRSPVPALVVWAAGDKCPRCSTALTLGRRSEPGHDARSRGGVVVAPARAGHGHAEIGRGGAPQ